MNRRPFTIERRPLAPKAPRRVVTTARPAQPTPAIDTLLVADLRKQIQAGRFPRSFWEPCGGGSATWVAAGAEIAAGEAGMGRNRHSIGGGQG